MHIVMKRTIAWGVCMLALALPLAAGAASGKNGRQLNSIIIGNGRQLNGIIIGNGRQLNGIIIGNGRSLGTGEGATGVSLSGVHVEGGRLVR
jgi:hypothetical protein